MTLTVTREQELKTLEMERSMFGCTLAEFKASTPFTCWEDAVDLNILAQSILSDVQQLLGQAPVNVDRIRQFTNRARFAVGEATRLQRLREVKGA